MLASRLLTRAPRSKAIATVPSTLQGHAAPGQISSNILQSRLFSSVQMYPAKRPSVLLSTVRQPHIIASMTPARFKSTITAVTPTIPTPTPVAVNSEFAPFDSVTPLDFTTLTEVQKTIPEQIGFLKELGLDFGWGPSTCMQWLLEHVHIWSGQPWWASIILATLVIRLAQLPFYLKLSDAGARMREVQPFVQPLMDKMSKAQLSKDLVAMHLVRKEINDIYKKAGVSKKWLFFPLTQIPVFYGFYTVLRSMAQVPVPGLLEGGLAWFSNLSIPDPLFILPIISAGSIALSIASGGDGGASTMTAQTKNLLMIGLPVLSLAFMWNWPAAMTVYFATSGVLGLIQNLALRSPSARKALNLYPLPQPEPVRRPLVDVNAVSEPVDARSKLSSKVKELMSVENTPPMVKNMTNWISDTSKNRSLASYESKRNAEEAARKKAIIEEKRRRASMKDEL